MLVSQCRKGRYRQAGVTLVELMIGTTLGLVVLSSVLAVYRDTVITSSDSLRIAQLNQQLQASLEIMHRDLRRAGYIGLPPGSTTLASLASNPFTDADNPAKAADQRNDLRTGRYHNTSSSPAHSEADDSCVLYSYDHDGNGVVKASGDGMERYGFRLLRGALQMRMGGDADAFNCTDGSWTAITDDNIEITQLQFQVNSTGLSAETPASACVAGEGCVSIRTVTIGLTGRLRNDQNQSQQLTDTVRVRNDRYLPPV